MNIPEIGQATRPENPVHNLLNALEGFRRSNQYAVVAGSGAEKNGLEKVVKSTAVASFRERLQQNELLAGLWLSLGAAAVADISAGLGLDWIVVDANDGWRNQTTLTESVRATQLSHTLLLLHLQELSTENVDFGMAMGVDGFVVYVDSLSQLDQLISCVGKTRPSPYQRDGAVSNVLADVTMPRCQPVVFTALSNLDVPMIEKLLSMTEVDSVAIPSLAVCGHEAQNQERSNDLIRSVGNRLTGFANTEKDVEQFLASGIRNICLGTDRGILRSELTDVLFVANELSVGTYRDIAPLEFKS